MAKIKYILYCPLAICLLVVILSLFHSLYPAVTEAENEGCRAPDPPIFLQLDDAVECPDIPENEYYCENSKTLLDRREWQFSFCYLSGVGFKDLDEHSDNDANDEKAICKVERDGYFWKVTARVEYGAGGDPKARCQAHCLYIPH